MANFILNNMLNYIKYGFKAAKPRIMTENQKNLKEYRIALRESRRKVHEQSVKHQNQLEDQFLERHKTAMREKHFKNKCDFRAKVAQESYYLYKNIQRIQQQHAQKMEKLQKYVHREEMKKINRERIKKILEYESHNYWLTNENIDAKLGSGNAQNILPDYIGTTQYYHKLYAEALAYESLDFDMLEKVTNKQEIVAEKNQLLMPVWKDVLELVKKLKRNELQIKKKQYEVKCKQIMVNQEEGQQQAKLKQAQQQYEKNIEALCLEYNDPETKRKFLKRKLTTWVNLLKKWKEYTIILNLTTIQIRKMMEEKSMESSIEIEKKKIKTEVKKQKQSKFIDPVEEDTQDDSQVTLEQFLNKTKGKKVDEQAGLNFQGSDHSIQLETLMQDQQKMFQGLSSQIQQLNQKYQSENKKIKAYTTQSSDNVEPQDEEEVKIDKRILNINQTTVSIEAIKEEYKDDPEIISLLNATGQIVIDYPKLFRKVWEGLSI